MLLHGWNATGALNWARTIDRLGEHYHVVALDHRGHGQGIKDGTAFSLEACADDAVALLDSLGITSAIFLGYSMGGPIAQLVWQRHPHRVDGLVFYATAADFTGISNLGPLVRAYGALAPATRVVPRKLRTRLLRPLIGPFVADDAVRQDLMAALGDHDERTILEASQCVHQHDASGWIQQIDVPTAVIVTQRDQVIAPEAQRRLAQLIPGSVTLEIPDGHLIPFTDPEMTALFALDACDLVAQRARRPLWHRLLDHIGSIRARWGQRR